MNRAFSWEIIVTYIIGFSLMLFCLYILLGDITSLTVSETTNVSKIEFNDDLNEVTVEFYTESKLRRYSKRYKDKNDYTSIKQSPNAKVRYNPYFNENVYIENRLLPTFGELVLFSFGIFLIYMLMCYVVNVYKHK